jgi:hypothetical protein
MSACGDSRRCEAASPYRGMTEDEEEAFHSLAET